MVRFCSMLLCRNGEMPEWHIAETSPKAEIAGNRFGTINFKFAAEMPVKHFGFAIARLQGINIYLALPPVGQIRHVGEFNPAVFVPFTQGRTSWHARTRTRIAIGRATGRERVGQYVESS